MMVPIFLMLNGFKLKAMLVEQETCKSEVFSQYGVDNLSLLLTLLYFQFKIPLRNKLNRNNIFANKKCSLVHIFRH
uniref:Uncharacterized protein n=1 Tax=Octopus bimaculoides TaxID=37653 RepID=A0A0L8HP73_OCTBM